MGECKHMSNTDNNFGIIFDSIEKRIRKIENDTEKIFVENKNTTEKIERLEKKIDKVLYMLTGNGNVEDGMIFRVSQIEKTQRECPVNELKKQTKLIVIAGIITLAIAMMKFVFKDFLKFF